MKSILYKCLVIFITMQLLCSISNWQQKKLERPRLVIGIVVDQMRWDYLYRYYNRYSENGFKRILQEGFNCQNTYLSYLPTYTAPGHASIYTGAVPALHGIVGNDWIENYNSTYCCADNSVRAVGGYGKAGQMSPRNLKSSTIGDALKLATQFSSKVYGVALKDRGAIFPAGHSANAAFWFDDSSGHFISSTYYMQQLPKWLQLFNEKKWSDSALAEDWHTLYPLNTYTQSAADDNPFEHLRKHETAPIFPHKTIAKQYAQLRSLPAGNSLCFKMAKQLIKHEQLGLDATTDLLCVSLSTTDYIGHAYGPQAVEVEDCYLRLDQDIAQFLNYLDQHIGKQQYTLFITADHGAAHNANYLKSHRIPAGILSEYRLRDALKKALKQAFHSDSILLNVMNYQVFLNHQYIEKKKLPLERIKQFIIKYCEQEEGIAYALTYQDLKTQNLALAWQLPLLKGYYPKRCGDIALIYQHAWYSDGDKGTTHGAWNPYDAHIPLLWYGWGVSAGESFKRYSQEDIAASLAALLHIQVPNACTGNVIIPLLKSK